MTTEARPPSRLWYSYGADMPLLQVGPGGFLFGRGSEVDVDLSTLSRRVYGAHVRIWFIRGAHLVYNTCMKGNATYIAREVKETPPKNGNVKVELPGGKEVLVLSLEEVAVDAGLDLSLDSILLVGPSAPDGHVLLRFLPDNNGDYNLAIQPVKLEVIK